MSCRTTKTPSKPPEENSSGAVDSGLVLPTLNVPHPLNIVALACSKNRDRCPETQEHRQMKESRVSFQIDLETSRRLDETPLTRSDAQDKN